MNNSKDRIFNLRFNWRSYISQNPRLYSAWIGLRSPSIVIGISKQSTDLVLEGYPRSGNTFAWSAFVMAQSRPFNIMHHSHKPARIIEAVKSDIPTLVLIREPKDCVLSYCIYEPRLSIRMGLVHWIRFYRSIKPYNLGYVLATFDNVITDFGDVIAIVNKRFGSQFEKFDHTPENERLVFKQIDFRMSLISNRGKYSSHIDDRIGKPSEQRKEKLQIKEVELFRNKNNSKLLGQAQDLYNSLLVTN